jgi:hypothetical protein
VASRITVLLNRLSCQMCLNRLFKIPSLFRFCSSAGYAQCTNCLVWCQISLWRDGCVRPLGMRGVRIVSCCAKSLYGGMVLFVPPPRARKGTTLRSVPHETTRHPPRKLQLFRRKPISRMTSPTTTLIRRFSRTCRPKIPFVYFSFFGSILSSISMLSLSHLWSRGLLSSAMNIHRQKESVPFSSLGWLQYLSSRMNRSPSGLILSGTIMARRRRQKSGFRRRRQM